jgi:hypothetical protein
MHNSPEDVTAFFQQSGYAACPRSQTGTASELLLFESTFVGIGLFLAPAAEVALQKSADFQVAIADARAQHPRGRLKDWYLIFVLPEVQLEDGPGIQDMINDTHVCRKIVLEQNDRPLSEVLSEMPFFRLTRPSATATSAVPDAVAELSRPGLPVNLLVDLAKRSPREIIKRTLRSKYKSGGGRDET